MSILHRGDRLIIATHNRGKFEEIDNLFEKFGLDLGFAADLGLSSPVEDQSTFVGNARIKAHAAAQETGYASLSDDSGLEIDCLNGLPGVWSADWAETPSGRNFEHAIERVRKEILTSGAESPWSARFRCCLVLALPDGSDHVFEGRVEGFVSYPPRGTFGHGYDPIFIPENHSLTFAEMNRWEKNRMSHRSRAFDEMIEACFT
jgi:XTP/dITP diphosphohydrolase